MHKTNGSSDLIKTVFDKLGETLDFEKKALRKMNVDSLLRTNKAEKAGLIVLAASSIIWVVVLRVSSDALYTLQGLILLLTNMVIIVIVLAHKLVVAWRMRRRSVKQSIDDTYKRAIGNWVAGKDIADIADSDTLNQVELLLKSEVDEFQARGNLIINVLKNINPLLIALGVLFGLFGLTTGRGAVLAIVVVMVATTANILALFTEVGLQPEIIRCKQCLSIIGQAKALKESKAEKQAAIKSSELSTR
jgi:hypothetical protein